MPGTPAPDAPPRWTPASPPRAPARGTPRPTRGGRAARSPEDAPHRLAPDPSAHGFGAGAVGLRPVAAGQLAHHGRAGSGRGGHPKGAAQGLDSVRDASEARAVARPLRVEPPPVVLDLEGETAAGGAEADGRG